MHDIFLSRVMATRAFYGFRYRGRYYLWYNHFDGYPSWLGKKIVDALRRHVRAGTIEKLLCLLLRMRVASSNGEREELAPLWQAYMKTAGYDKKIAEGDGTGEIMVDLDCGIMLANYGDEGIPCEIQFVWGYVIDLDTETFDVYGSFGELRKSYELADLPEFTSEDDEIEDDPDYWEKWNMCMNRDAGKAFTCK